MNTALATTSMGPLENVLINGDLSKLQPEERVMYYKSVCESVGLNPLTKPFEYITLNGKLTLYARRDATDQLRNIHKVSITIVARETVEDCYVVTARATTPARQDESIGAVNIQGLKGEARANAMMKAETKAKRRVTLSVCGLGLLDETEVETIAPNTKATAGVLGSLPVKIQEIIVDTATQVKALLANDQTMDAYALWQNSKFDTEETIAFWSLFDSKQRGALGRLAEAEKARDNGAISPTQKKRLEARIGELKLPRDTVKDHCLTLFQKNHFAELTNEEYKALEEHLDKMVAAKESHDASGAQKAAPSHVSTAAPRAAPTPVDAGQGEYAGDAATAEVNPVYKKLRDAYQIAPASIKARFDLRVKDYGSIDAMPLAKADLALAWLNKEIDKEVV